MTLIPRILTNWENPSIKLEIRKKKSENRIMKDEIRNSKHETRNSKHETRNPKHETRNSKHENEIRNNILFGMKADKFVEPLNR